MKEEKDWKESRRDRWERKSNYRRSKKKQWEKKHRTYDYGDEESASQEDNSSEDKE